MEKIHPAVAATNVKAAHGAIRCIAQRRAGQPAVCAYRRMSARQLTRTCVRLPDNDGSPVALPVARRCCQAAWPIRPRAPAKTAVISSSSGPGRTIAAPQCIAAT